MPVLNEAKKSVLRRIGVSILRHGDVMLPEECVFEPPCSLKWMVVDHSLEIGAFSYAVNGYFFGVRIGRYVSIGEDVQIGRGSHPTTWITTSPILYREHSAVLDRVWEPAKSFKPTCPALTSTPTTIGSDVYIGHGALIMQGVTIGDGAVIGAGAVVTRDIPPYAIAVGSPATVKKMRFPEKLIEKVIGSRWTDYAFWDFSGLSVDDPEHFCDELSKLVANGLQPYKPEKVLLKHLEV